MNSLSIPLIAESLPESSVVVFAQSEMKLGRTSMMQNDTLSLSLAKDDEKVVRVVQGSTNEVRVITDGAEPQKRRTFELPMTNEDAND